MMGSLVVLARLIPPAAFGPYAVAVRPGTGDRHPGSGVGSALVQRTTANREHLPGRAGHRPDGRVIMTASTYLAAGAIVEPVFGAPTASLVALSSPLFIIYAIGTVPFATLRAALRLPAPQRVGHRQYVSAPLRLDRPRRRRTGSPFAGHRRSCRRPRVQPRRLDQRAAAAAPGAPGADARPARLRHERLAGSRQLGGIPQLRLRDHRRAGGLAAIGPVLPRVHAGGGVPAQGQRRHDDRCLPGALLAALDPRSFRNCAAR